MSMLELQVDLTAGIERRLPSPAGRAHADSEVNLQTLEVRQCVVTRVPSSFEEAAGQRLETSLT